MVIDRLTHIVPWNSLLQNKAPQTGYRANYFLGQQTKSKKTFKNPRKLNQRHTELYNIV